jgi:MOSC domain-containing protein
MTSAGTVTALWRFPVKSMLGERPESVQVTAAGLAGDRAYAIIDAVTGKIASAKHPRLWPDLLGCRAAFTEVPLAGAPPPPARIELANGTIVMTDAPDVDAVLSKFFGRDVRLTTAAPEKFAIDEYHPDAENLNPQGDRDNVTEQLLGSTFFEAVGLPSAVPAGALFDLFPLSVLTTSSLEQLRRLQPHSAWDMRRFRMNVIVDTPGDGFVENAWPGRLLSIGDDVEILAALPTPRCVMTNLAQQDLARDPDVLKTIAGHNRLDVAGAGLYPCAGVYAVASKAGVIRTGDQVRVRAG